MQMLIRPYNADGTILESAVTQGARPAGLMVDAHIAKLAPKAVSKMRTLLNGTSSFMIDPVTHKIRKTFFRAKSKSFQRLPYFFTSDLGTDVPSLKVLDDRAATGAREVFSMQQDLGVTEFISPYLFAESNSFPSGSKPTSFSVGSRWSNEFAQIASGRPICLSVCVLAECLADPDALGELDKFIKQHRPRLAYLMIFDFELGESPVLDRAVHNFVKSLRDRGVERIIYSHAPSWIPFLAGSGITDFVTGINYLTTLKREYLDRTDDIAGIQHNYYIARRFCRLTPAQAVEAIDAQLINPCSCPACGGDVPDTINRIREHYIHARLSECEDLKRAADPRALVRTWANSTEEFLAEAEDADVKVIGDPKPTQWRQILA